MRARVHSIDDRLRGALGKLKVWLGLSNDTRVRPWSHMHTRRTPGTRKSTDNDLEKVKLWSSSIKL